MGREVTVAGFLDGSWSLLLAPLGWIWRGVARIRSFLFARGWKARVRPPTPTLSIGNLAVGGTGKTPLLFEALGRLAASEIKTGVLSRGYGGDEGVMLRNRFPDVDLEEDPDRVRGLAAMLERGKPDVLLLDDGFQHFQLERDKDVVLLDAQLPWGRCLPSGPFREGREALRRADCVILSRVGAVDGNRRAEIWREVDAIRKGLPSLSRVEGDLALRDLRCLADGRVEAASWLDGSSVFLAAGVARPESFRRLCERAGAVVTGVDWKGDHHPWKAVDQEAWVKGYPILVTEKDAVKMEACEGLDIWEVRVDWAFHKGEEDWQALLESLALPSRAARIEPLWEALDSNAGTQE